MKGANVANLAAPRLHLIIGNTISYDEMRCAARADNLTLLTKAHNILSLQHGAFGFSKAGIGGGHCAAIMGGARRKYRLVA